MNLIKERILTIFPYYLFFYKYRVINIKGFEMVNGIYSGGSSFSNFYRDPCDFSQYTALNDIYSNPSAQDTFSHSANTYRSPESHRFGSDFAKTVILGGLAIVAAVATWKTGKFAVNLVKKGFGAIGAACSSVRNCFKRSP